jgi:hypothetical protein
LKAIADEKSGIFEIKEGQTSYPKVITDRLMAQYKTPRRIDNGPIIPLFHKTMKK